MPQEGLLSHEVLRWLHVVTFALWFGTDLGVFTASLAVTDARLTIDVRRYALRLLCGRSAPLKRQRCQHQTGNQAKPCHRPLRTAPKLAVYYHNVRGRTVPYAIGRLDQ